MMEKVLSQDQIDALFHAAVGDSATEPGLQSDAASQSVAKAFNFSCAGRISNDQMRAIATVNDLFGRNLTHTVAAWLRTEFHVALVSGEQIAYTEYTERIAEQSLMSSVRLEPLGASGLIEMDLALALPMVDLLLGGTGRPQAVRPLTEVEELIMASVIGMIVKELNTAWQPVGLQFGFEKRESPSEVARMMPAGEKVLCVSFEVRMQGVQGLINLCLPAMVLNTILRKLVAARDRPRRSFDVRMRVRELTGMAQLPVVLQCPPVRISARELGALEPGSVVRLPIPRHATAELRLGGLSLRRARPVRMGEHRGARIEPTGGQPDTAAQESTHD
jgi:flagellar motor switch protein FliM